MRRAVNDLQSHWAGELRLGAAVQLNDDGVELSDDEECRRQNAGKSVRCEVRSATPRDNRRYQLRSPRGRGQCRRRARTGPEKPHPQIGRAFLLFNPVERLLEAARKQRDIKLLASTFRFTRQQEIEQQRGKPSLVERAGNLGVARAEPA
jgi:hypothetical protein